MYPAIAHLHRACKIARTDPPARKLDQLVATLRRTSIDLDRIVPLLASLMSIPLNGHFRTQEMSAKDRRRATIDALVEQLMALAQTAPVLFLFEDAHWVDPTTEELLQTVVDRVEDVPVLLVVTFPTGVSTDVEGPQPRDLVDAQPAGSDDL